MGLGNVYARQGNLDAAVSEYQKAKIRKQSITVAEHKKNININPNDVASHYSLGVTYQNQGDLDAAVTEYRKVIELNPKHAAAHYSLGGIYQNRGNLDAAVAK